MALSCSSKACKSISSCICVCCCCCDLRPKRLSSKKELLLPFVELFELPGGLAIL